MPDCYIAAALFTPAQIRVNGQIAAVAREVGLNPVLPSEMSAAVWKGRAPKDCTQEERREVLMMNINGMHGAQYVIARVSGDTKEVDTGVAFEMGYYSAIQHHEVSGDNGAPRRYLIAYIEPSDKAQSLNLMLAESVDAAVYGLAQLHALLRALCDVEYHPAAEMVSRSHVIAHTQMILDRYSPSKIVMHEREPIGFGDDDTRNF